MFNVILSAREFNGHWVMSLRGELDLAGAPSAAAHLSAAVAGHRPRVVVDPAGVEYIGANGRGVRDHAVRPARGRGDQRQCRRTWTRSGPAAPTRRGPSWRDLTPPARTIVGLSFRLDPQDEIRLDPQDEKGLRPAQPTSAPGPAVSAHDAVAGPAARPKRRAFPGRADQIAKARDFTRRVLAACPVLDEATLLVGELATNAVAHTATGSGGQFDVIIYRDEALIIIAVMDEGSDNAPASRPHGLLAEDGRGLRLVELIADRWGYCGDERGRTIWLELRWKNP
jgi:anti-sigma regulatory factor (Ser/Thr protein kinase)